MSFWITGIPDKAGLMCLRLDLHLERIGNSPKPETWFLSEGWEDGGGGSGPAAVEV